MDGCGENPLKFTSIPHFHDIAGMWFMSMRGTDKIFSSQCALKFVKVHCALTACVFCQ